MPPAWNVTTNPATVHTAVVFEVTATARPDVDVAVTVTEAEASGSVATGENVMAWLDFTKREKFCVASGNLTLCAVKISGKEPAVSGVPLSSPVGAVKVTPLGSVPVYVSVGVGRPVAVTVKLPTASFVKVVVLALVIAGLSWQARGRTSLRSQLPTGTARSKQTLKAPLQELFPTGKVAPQQALGPLHELVPTVEPIGPTPRQALSPLQEPAPTWF